VAIKEFGTPEGWFEISDTASASYEKPTIEAIAVSGRIQIASISTRICSRVPVRRQSGGRAWTM